MKRRGLSPLVAFLLLSLGGCVVAHPAPTPARSSATRAVVRSGERQRIDYIFALNPDCTTAGYATVRIIALPVHGELTTERGVDYSLFPKQNQRYHCNLKKSPVMNIYYKSFPGYVGADTATIEWVSPVVATPTTKIFAITVE